MQLWEGSKPRRGRATGLGELWHRGQGLHPQAGRLLGPAVAQVLAKEELTGPMGPNRVYMGQKLLITHIWGPGSRNLPQAPQLGCRGSAVETQVHWHWEATLVPAPSATLRNRQLWPVG